LTTTINCFGFFVFKQSAGLEKIRNRRSLPHPPALQVFSISEHFAILPEAMFTLYMIIFHVPSSAQLPSCSTLNWLFPLPQFSEEMHCIS